MLSKYKWAILAAVLCGIGLTAAAQNGALVYLTAGGATQEVVSGGAINVASGGAVNIASGGSLKYNTVAFTGAVVGGSYSVTAGDDTANTKAITTGLSTITTQVVQVLRSGKNVASDIAISVSGGTLTVADGSTYVLTSGDVIKWIAVGS